MISPRPARGPDAGVLHALREQRARWMTDAGIRQWRPGEVGVGEVEAQVAAGEWHVLEAGDRLVAGLRLLWSDAVVWGDVPGDAAYVHGLVVDPAHAGAGIGAALLAWAAATAAGAGRSRLRLDCVESNPRLRRYYRDRGFTEVGRRVFDSGWDPVVLLEKGLGKGAAAS
ncbi:GNAT family N-acetyltransferase [Blastococcus xanthinilyticus]|uniref:Ribosomal protein S18 acetylase RimI-like enzyme n=1 Tax=Blastococcus xanthinilyticus TaxID=1564164 RepID=A0A5S5CQC1_9ACTN|nr:GNAT family N-acetyltransferase [Blastococcus xanthinilyticus]TYP86000.1 ribosomal protein S18 acetylase RimI-like enzyme [Blastococcus xanthinilyticus]